MPDLREFSFLTVCLRLVLAVVAGGIIGFGSSRKKETAGLRTYLITCVGAALTALLAMYEYQMFTRDWASAAGAGFYEGAVLATALILLAETLLGNLAGKIRRDPEFRICVVFRHKPVLGQVLRVCKNRRMAITNLHVVSDVQEGLTCYKAYVSLRPRTQVNREKLFGDIQAVTQLLEFAEVPMEE